ncbi:MAG: tetratricopeptide repeat protein [Proteobacteria bacterium]|nr:tetratricopeptide repeat protein [Pseudomonadota bacterium]
MSDFQYRLEELRNSIYKGNVSEGVLALGTWLIQTQDPSEQAEILLEIVLLSVACGDIDEARTRWEQVKILSEYYQKLRFRAYRALFLMLDGKKKKGIACFEECLLEQPNHFEFYLLRAFGYAEYEDYEYALADLERANTLSPDNVLVMAMMADVYVELGQRDKAISLHETVLEACPDFRRSLMSLGLLYMDMNRREDAFRLFQCLVAYDPMNWFAWACLGDIRVQTQGRTFQALTYYAASIASGSNVSQTFLNMAKGLFILGKYRQGGRILRKFEESPDNNQWEAEDIFSVRYLLLINDVIEQPEIVKKSEFMQRFRMLKPYDDEANGLLFQILSSLCSFTYRDDMLRIVGCHLKAFVHMAHYMQLCENRLIQPEEAILIGILARMYIWNGMLFEARAILGILSRADEPRILDMTALLWNELYEYGIAAQNSGVELEKYHESLIRDEGMERYFKLLIGDKHENVSIPDKWHNNLVRSIEKTGFSDLSYALFHVPFERALAHLEEQIGKDSENAAASLRQFWTMVQVWWNLKKSSGTVSIQEFRKQMEEEGVLSAPLAAVFREFVCSNARDDWGISGSHKTENDSYWSSVFGAIARRSHQIGNSFEIIAANDNMTQVCAAAIDEALSGFEPLPFTLDGTAFKRMLPAWREKVFQLNDDHAEELLKLLIERSLFIMERKTSGGSVCMDDGWSDKVDAALTDIQHFRHAMHGMEAFPESIFHLANRGRLRELVLRLSENNAACRFLMSDLMEKATPSAEWYLPQSRELAVMPLYKIQRVPEYPRSADILSGPVPYNLLTRRDLAEQFFNRAVLAIEQWHETRNPETLRVFVQDGIFRFQKFQYMDSDAKCRTRNNASKASGTFRNIEIRNVDFKHTVRFVGLNSDVEIKGGEHKKERPRKVVSRRSPIRADSTRIYSVGEMAESMDAFDAWLRSRRMPLLDIEYNPGVYRHPFALQFRSWAEKHADAIWPEVLRIETHRLVSDVGGYYVVIWHLHDLLNQYPYLSRLYLILAGVYSKIGEQNKAMNAVQTGLSWEDLLYQKTGWMPVHSGKKGGDTPLEIQEAQTEFEEPQSVLWPEHYVFQANEESMYHYGDIDSGFGLRRRYPLTPPGGLQRVVYNDKGGGFEFYRLFKRFIVSDSDFKSLFLDALCKPGVYTLRDYLAYVATELVAPASFPLRREIAEMLFQLYPDENPGVLGRFYCDNLQPANALPYAAYAYMISATEDGDDGAQAALTLGCLLYDMGFMKEAMEYLNVAVSARNPSPMAFLTMGCALIEMRDFDKAIECIKDGQKLDPSSDRFYYNLSLAYIEQGKLDEAEQAIKSGISLSKYPVDLNMQLMRVYVKRGMYVEALPLARYVAREDPEMFINALKFFEFSEFVKLKAVQNLLDECTYGVEA